MYTSTARRANRASTSARKRRSQRAEEGFLFIGQSSEIKVDKHALPGQMDHRETEKKHGKGQALTVAAEALQHLLGIFAAEHHKQQYLF